MARAKQTKMAENIEAIRETPTLLDLLGGTQEARLAALNTDQRTAYEGFMGTMYANDRTVGLEERGVEDVDQFIKDYAYVLVFNAFLGPDDNVPPLSPNDPDIPSEDVGKGNRKPRPKAVGPDVKMFFMQRYPKLKSFWGFDREDFLKASEGKESLIVSSPDGGKEAGAKSKRIGVTMEATKGRIKKSIAKPKMNKKSVNTKNPPTPVQDNISRMAGWAS